MIQTPIPTESNPRTGRVLGYVRVSTDDQNLDLQLDALKRVGCDQVYQDHGVSGIKANRPGLEQLVEELCEGDTLVVYKLDRLGRSVQHLSDLLVHFDDKGIQFCALSEGISTKTYGGKMIFHIFAAIAEFERGLIRERTCAGLVAARQRGSKIGRPRIMTDEDVLAARQFMLDAGKTFLETASEFGVSESTLQRGLRRLQMNTAT